MGRRRSLQALLAALTPLGLADGSRRRSSSSSDEGSAESDASDSAYASSSSSSSSSSGHSPDEEAPPSPLPDFLDEDPFAPPPPPVAPPETSYYDEMDNFASYYAPPPPPKPSVALPSQILARSTMKSGGDSRSRTPSLVELTNARLPRRMVRRGRVGAQLPVEPWADEGAENMYAAPVPMYVGRLGAAESSRPSWRQRTMSAPSPVRPSPLHHTSRSEGTVARSKSGPHQPSPLSRAL
ncbi:hypothetical protein EV122DRAFT_258211 [Schizophyllum commune]|nr:hypothetical protein K525DRAFT_262346 [Schizophyllum commune Loenen D]